MSNNHRPLTEQQIVECIRKLLDFQRSTEWVGAKYLYAQFFAHPERFGASDVYALPKYPGFERICRAMFTIKHDELDGDLMVRVDNG